MSVLAPPLRATSAHWIDPVCPICGAIERRERLRDGRFRIVQCRECELVYVTPRLEDAALLAEIYDASYWRSSTPRERGYADYLGDEQLHRRTIERRLRGLQRHLPSGGRALELGCAAGFFLEALRERGFEVAGIEPSTPMRAEAQRRLGAERVVASLEDLGQRRFECAFLWDVIEHVPDPLRTLEQCARRLETGGVLVLETQDVESLAARVLGRRWHHFKHGEHLQHFSATTLRRALEHCGLRLEELTRRGAGKYVRASFVAERARRLGPLAAVLAAPLALASNFVVYVNPLDELIAVARKV